MRKLAAVVLAMSVASCGAKSVDLDTGTEVVTPSADPTVLGSVPEAVVTMVVDDERLYWCGARDASVVRGGPLGKGAIRSCDKRDCASSLVTYSTDPWDSKFAVLDGNVYWVSGRPASPYPVQALFSCPSSGCVGSPQVLGDVSQASAFALGPDAMYSLGTDGTLMRLPFSGAPAQRWQTSLLEQNFGSAAVHDDYLYAFGGYTSPLLVRMRTDGTGAPETVIAGSHVASMAFDEAFVYWADGLLSGSLLRCPLAGCTGEPEVVAAPVRTPSALAIDGPTLFFEQEVDLFDFGLATCPLGSCRTPTPIVGRLDTNTAFAVDSHAIYAATTDQELDSGAYFHAPVAQLRRFAR